jgi:diguanylate cyclase (GGDEF)-like protein
MVLMELSALLRRCVRGSDTVCRYGGEEFALLLPDARLEGAQRKAEEIRAAVKALDLRFHGKRVGVLSASFGVALFPDHAADAEPLLSKADEALYGAKAAGRDRVVVSDAAAPAKRAAGTDPALTGSAAPGVPTSRTEPSS